MSYIDLALVGAFLVALFDGYRRGFIVHALDVVILVPAIYCTIVYASDLADWLVLSHDVTPLRARMLAPVSIFVGLQLVGTLLTTLVSRKVPEEVRDSPANHWAGLAPAGLKMMALSATVLMIIQAVPTPATRNLVKGSLLAPPLAAMAHFVADRLDFPVDAAVQRAFERYTVSNRTHGHERVAIPPVSDAKQRVEPSLEEQMLLMVNEERKAVHLPPLRFDEKLQDVARDHSRDMWRRGYFAHEDPDGKDVADRVRAAHIPFGLVGENIALAPSLQAAHEGLMLSPDHRANILDPRFKRVGYGIILGGANGIMVTQNFGD